MNLWLSAHLLVVGMFLSGSALTPEECQPLVTPLSLDDPQVMLGRTNFIVGYTDNDVYNAILKTTESSWVNITKSPSNPNQVVMSQENKMNGTCLASTVNVTIDGSMATTSLANIVSVFHLLPSCDGCLVFSINSTAKKLDKLLQTLKIDSSVKEDVVTARALYLMGKQTTLTDAELEHFKKQASCLGFDRDPDFVYDPKNGFCAEGEGIRFPLE